MIVIADTSPLNYLILIGEADVLQRLYGRVVIPAAVLRELQNPQAPAKVAEWIASLQHGLKLREVRSRQILVCASWGKASVKRSLWPCNTGKTRCCSWTKAMAAGKPAGEISASPARWES